MIKRISRSLLLTFVFFLCVSCAHNLDAPTKYGTDKVTVAADNAIHYVEVGQGPPVLLIPGLFGTHSIFDRVIPLLKDHYRLLAIDNFGTGQSGRPEGGFDYLVAEQADRVVAMMDELEIASCDIVGVSYGGMIALNIAARYPERVVSIVAIEGAVIMPKNTPYRRLIQGLKYPIFGDAIIGFVRSGLFDETMAEDIMGPSWDDLSSQEQDEITGIVAKNADVASRRTWLSLARALNDVEDFTEEAKSITAPVLYLSGDLSEFREMTDMNIAFFKEHLPNVEMVSFADGVHDLELQKPKETAALILDFIGPSDSGPLVTASEPEP
ncbi:pimeloyl-ACP methyl ester carboxylesterase [Desulfuromonas soudanensis]|uniref:Pimeloyl-ACP methyl ester carboxylesterase n=1 Tax=Desulfuromonas soudanensis TaxID=1603606 RepID=A0A0M3QER6_9BACT|nr:alpha/beta hydrolase [Desulfuromonas soudanensis]ALC14909.1 pimeloyl-ACP methyl ester carboxylesterase [Desulfuromonas soudanensis]